MIAGATSDLRTMPDRTPPSPPTIDMTLDGAIVAPRTRLSRLLAFWRALPRGALPALVVALGCVAAVVIVVVGLALLALPVLVVLALLALVPRLLAAPRR